VIAYLRMAADFLGVGLALRFPISAGLLAFALLATSAVFLLARPQYHPAIEVENVNLAQEPHYTVSEVRAAFEAHGIRLAYTRRDESSAMTWLSRTPPPWPDTTLYVTVLHEKGMLGLGHEDGQADPYETRVGNVLVHFGGRDVDAIRVTVASLRPRLR
jgi:hypothetical protein